MDTGSKTRGDGARLSREDWLNHGLAMLGRAGPDAIRLEALCAGLGVTKGSFYWHFASRADFLKAVFAAWEARETDAIIARVEARGGPPLDRLSALYDEALSGRVDFASELAIRHWARHDRTARAAMRRVDERRIDYMEGLLTAAGADAARAATLSTLLYGVILGEALAGRDETPEARRRRRRTAFEAALAGLPRP